MRKLKTRENVYQTGKKLNNFRKRNLYSADQVILSWMISGGRSCFILEGLIRQIEWQGMYFDPPSHSIFSSIFRDIGGGGLAPSSEILGGYSPCSATLVDDIYFPTSIMSFKCIFYRKEYYWCGATWKPGFSCTFLTHTLILAQYIKAESISYEIARI